MPQKEDDIVDKEATIPLKPPIYAHLTWPVAHFLALMGIEHKDTEMKPAPARPYMNFREHVASCSNGFRAFLVACFVIFWLHGGDDGYGYPAFGRAAEWNIDWMWPILLRNLIGCYAIAGGWDYIL